VYGDGKMLPPPSRTPDFTPEPGPGRARSRAAQA